MFVMLATPLSISLRKIPCERPGRADMSFEAADPRCANWLVSRALACNPTRSGDHG